jgi:hypothetical protein
MPHMARRWRARYRRSSAGRDSGRSCAPAKKMPCIRRCPPDPIQLPGYAPIGFDVFVRPDETITYRANIY